MTQPHQSLARRVLVDTSAYFMLSDADQAQHAVAASLITQLGDQRWRLFTTNFILAETHALFLARLGRSFAWRILTEIDQSATVLVRVSAADERRAREILRRYTDKDFSYTDATSFAVMERLRIPAAFTYDRDFAQYGFPPLVLDQL
ncbi:MAG: PIN domain-containing protein [Dehalococcoidia bacterium]